MKKKELIDKIFDKFENSREDIKLSLLNDLNVFILQTKDKDEVVKITITYERGDKRGK